VDERPSAIPEQPGRTRRQRSQSSRPATNVGESLNDGDPDQDHLPESDEAAELIALIDRLEGVLERSGLAELEVGSGATTIVLRSATSLSNATGIGVSAPPPTALDGQPAASASGPIEPDSSGLHPITAPLTGIYYTAPSPDAAPYVRVGAQVVIGQVIGLIEAMKLYNEIKSDIAGRVVRLAAEGGKLVKAKQVLIEVEPS
jgi:acetyl-CoA carboxylase biotin carboxyl carrier protein